MQEIQLPAGGGEPLTTRWTYEESFNHITRVTDPAGNSTTYDYNSSGSLITETNALGNTTTYDEDGTQTGTTDANGNDTETGDYHLAPPIPGFVITPTWDWAHRSVVSG